jgi:aconitate hydratase
MGILPLQFLPGQTAEGAGIRGDETFDIPVPGDLAPRQELVVAGRGEGGRRVAFRVVLRADTPVEVETLRQGGVLPAVLRRMLRA